MLILKSFPVFCCPLKFHKFALLFPTRMIQDNYETVFWLIVILNNICTVEALRLNHDRLVSIIQGFSVFSIVYIKVWLFIFDFVHVFRIKELKNYPLFALKDCLILACFRVALLFNKCCKTYMQDNRFFKFFNIMD